MSWSSPSAIGTPMHCSTVMWLSGFGENKSNELKDKSCLGVTKVSMRCETKAAIIISIYQPRSRLTNWPHIWGDLWNSPKCFIASLFLVFKAAGVISSSVGKSAMKIWIRKWPQTLLNLSLQNFVRFGRECFPTEKAPAWKYQENWCTQYFKEKSCHKFSDIQCGIKIWFPQWRCGGILSQRNLKQLLQLRQSEIFLIYSLQGRQAVITSNPILLQNICSQVQKCDPHTQFRIFKDSCCDPRRNG